MNRAVVECRLPDLFRPFLECLVKVSWSNKGNIPGFVFEELLVFDSIEEDSDADIISVGALSSNICLSEFILTDCIFNPELFVLNFEVIFCGVTVSSTFRKRVSKISFVFSMYYILKDIIIELSNIVNMIHE